MYRCAAILVLPGLVLLLSLLSRTGRLGTEPGEASGGEGSSVSVWRGQAQRAGPAARTGITQTRLQALSAKVLRLPCPRDRQLCWPDLQSPSNVPGAVSRPPALLLEHGSTTSSPQDTFSLPAADEV